MVKIAMQPSVVSPLFDPQTYSMNFSGQLTTILEKYDRDELNPEVWLPDRTLRPDVRENLLQIAHDFCGQHVLPDEAIEDITLTGSNANFNWGKFSDIDLHLIVDFSKVDENRELVYDYYRMAKSLWNSSHEIKICGHEVEVYVQDSGEPHHSTGVYSIQNGEWLIEPTKDNSTKPDESSVQQKAQDFVDRIDRISQMVKDDDDSASSEAEKLKDRVKKMRQAGLESAGEFSVENLAFKYLRNEGHLDRLSDLRRQAYDQSLSMDQCQTETSDAVTNIHHDF